mgnify:CR=1 FL=1
MQATVMTSLAERYHALVIGASGGIGKAVCAAIEADPRCGGLETLSRRADGLEIADEASVAEAAQRFSGQSFDLIVCATGALHIDGAGPEKTIRALDAEVMARQFSVNAIGPALLLKHFLPLMTRDRRAIFACLSARVGSIGDNHIGGWMSYRASKAALNQILRTAAPMAAMKAQQPERHRKLESLAGRPYFEALEAYGAGTSKERRRAALADSLKAHVTVVPPSRLLALLVELDPVKRREFQSFAVRAMGAAEHQLGDAWVKEVQLGEYEP